MTNSEILEQMGGRIRVRVGALLFEEVQNETSVLLVQHKGIWDKETFWTPPGGEVAVGEPLENALMREVAEETGLEIAVGPLMYAADFIRHPMHAVSLYFLCTRAGGDLFTGMDPELKNQLIIDVAFHSLSNLKQLHFVPEGMEKEILTDSRDGFSSPGRYIGTRR